jgi:hemerythrin-like metal-binding protein
MSIRTVAWSSDLSVGVKAFDRDHAGLAELLNEIVLAVDGGASRLLLEKLLRALAAGTEEHFRREEKYLQGIGFPDLARHIAEHRRLESEIRHLQAAFEAGEVALDDRMLEFLRHWLVDHVVDFDKDYAGWEGRS